jgi:hypothetical protein
MYRHTCKRCIEIQREGGTGNSRSMPVSGQRSAPVSGPPLRRQAQIYTLESIYEMSFNMLRYRSTIPAAIKINTRQRENARSSSQKRITETWQTRFYYRYEITANQRYLTGFGKYRNGLNDDSHESVMARACLRISGQANLLPSKPLPDVAQITNVDREFL